MSAMTRRIFFAAAGINLLAAVIKGSWLLYVASALMFIGAFVSLLGARKARRQAGGEQR